MAELRRKGGVTTLQVVTRELSYLFVIVAAIYSIQNPPRFVGLFFIEPHIRVLATTVWVTLAISGSVMVMFGHFFKLHNLEKGGISILVTVTLLLAVLGIYFDTSPASTLLSLLLLAFSFSQANRYCEVTREEIQADFATEIIKQGRGDKQ